jgi:hypothetical protein
MSRKYTPTLELIIVRAKYLILTGFEAIEEILQKTVPKQVHNQIHKKALYQIDLNQPSIIKIGMETTVPR